MEYNMLQLAYLGDAVYEVYVREYLLKSYTKLNELQAQSMQFVPAKRQNYLLNKLIEDEVLSSDELSIVRRGRNAKTHSKPRNCDVLTYKHATAFEALIGYLYVNDKERLEFLMDLILKIS